MNQHEWGVVAQSDEDDYQYCPLCKRFRDKDGYVRLADIPRDARRPDSKEPFFDGWEHAKEEK
jgi:hypothetical protein